MELRRFVHATDILASSENDSWLEMRSHPEWHEAMVVAPSVPGVSHEGHKGTLPRQDQLLKNEVEVPQRLKPPCCFSFSQ
jgi:hypothetical protein